MKSRSSSVVACAFVFAGFLSGRAASVFESGPEKVSLMELYTSEGCSSCPPAERWLGSLRTDPGLWRQFVPVAFHVKYWDNLGWRDRFAQASFEKRQRAYADTWGTRSVYTPAVVIDGRESRVDTMPRPSRDPVGMLRLEPQADGSVVIQFAPDGTERRGGYDVMLAYLGGGLVSSVKAGENAGTELRHEFVALRLDGYALMREREGRWSYTAPAPKIEVPSSPRAALVAWVVRRGEMTPIQAVGGWLTTER